ncbi:MAG: benzoate/H(+) symporter BenE family transporter [Rhodospirillales bacterium]
MSSTFSPQALFTGILAAFVGFASSFPVVLRGLSAVGATPQQAASGLMALSLAMGVLAILLSLKSRMPISIAWSTPGAALLFTAGIQPGGFKAAVGAFIVTSLLIILAGLWKPLGRWVAAIPTPLANAMLAGVLLEFCLAPVNAVAEQPILALAIILTWVIVAKINRLFAVPAAVLVTIVLIATTTHLAPGAMDHVLPDPVLVMPAFSWQAMIGIALPLFIVTMASQNVPGIAVLNVNGYRPDPGPLFRDTGIFSLLTAPFGGHGVNLAAITAALCAGPDAHPDPARRYWAAVVAGITYLLFGVLATAATAFISASPPILIEAVAGLALLGSFGSAMAGAVASPAEREAAVITFVITAASSVANVKFFGISGAFWGLVAGGLVLALTRWQVRKKPQP